MYIGKTSDFELTARLEGYLISTEGDTEYVPVIVTRDELDDEEIISKIVNELNDRHYGMLVAEILDKDGNIWY